MGRHHAVAAGMAAAVVLFATGEGCSGGEVTPCAALDASNFDQSCTTSSDCVVVTEPGSCCPGVAINGTAQAQYMAAATKAPANGCTPARGCTVSCPAAPPCCFGGKCQIGDRCPGPVTCTLGAACTGADICTGGIAGCTSNCQCLNGTWQAPCPQDAPQSGSACAPEGTECGYVTQAIACGGSVDCNCKSGAWSCGPTCVSPPTEADAGSLCAAAGGQCVSSGATCTTIVGPVQACDSDTPGGAFCCALAGSCTAKASNYDQSCKVDSDCVAVHEGDLCNLCALNCTNAAINVSAQARYMSDLVNTPAAISAQRLACTGDCTVQFGPCCIGGTCQMGGQCPFPAVPIGDAAADTGADSTTSNKAGDASAE